MTTHNTGTREQWLAARLNLLDAEKALTRQGDELSKRRRTGYTARFVVRPEHEVVDKKLRAPPEEIRE